jgi:hypothetical protein
MPAALASWCPGDVWRAAAVVLGRESITSVEPLYAHLSSHGSWEARLRGAVVHVKPVAGLTRDTLEAMIACHRQAIAHGILPALDTDPYALDADRLSVRVDEDAAGLSISLSSNSVDDAKRVLANVCASSCPQPLL